MGNETMSLREQILDAVPQASHTGILKMALDQNINDPNDPHWGMVALAWASTESASIARAALESVRKETGKIPDAIYQGTVKAGSDLKGQVEAAGQAVLTAAQAKGAELERKVSDAITRATTAGSAELKKAVTSLGPAAARKRDDLVQAMQVAAAEAARDVARAGLAGKIAKSWATVALSLLVAAGLGATTGAVITDTEINSPGQVIESNPGLRIYPNVTGGYTEVLGPDVRVQNTTGTAGCPAYRICLKVSSTTAIKR